MSLRLITVTVSDSRTVADDRSGPILAEELAVFEIVRHEMLKDEPEQIADLVRRIASSGECDALILSGGTGIAARDRTIEALTPLFEKTLDGFGEAFRRLSWDEVGARSMLSRAVAGVVGRLLVVALPGSPNAVRLAAKQLLVPMLPHAVQLLQGDTKHGAHS